MLLTSGSGKFQIRKGKLQDLDVIKRIADAHRNELGFIRRPALLQSIEREEVFVAVTETDLVGFVEYHHRRDQQTTLYHIVVVPEMRCCGIGNALFEALRVEASEKRKAFIRLKCPAELSANEFYASLGLERVTEENGKVRPLVVWELSL